MQAGLRFLRAGTADVLLALVLGALAEAEVVVGSGWPGPRWFAVIVAGVAAGALVVRRRQPLVSLLVVLAALGTCSLTVGAPLSATSFFIAVVAVYSAAAYSPRTWLVLAVTVTGSAIHSSGDPKVASVGDAVYEAVMLLLVFGVGVAMRKRHQRMLVVEEDADRREREAIDRERHRIERELHDVISHNIGIMVVQANAALQAFDRDPATAREMLAEMRATGQDALAEMRTLLSLVREGPDSTKPQPTLADVPALVASMRSAGVDVSLIGAAAASAAPTAVQLSAYRVIQEALTNAAKHARGAGVEVLLEESAGAVDIVVRDNGTATRGDGTRRGLAGMAERVAIFGGRFAAGPREDSGWQVRATLPFWPADAGARP